MPIAQKTLSKLEERVENARNTIFVQEQKTRSKRVLVIDDAVGSGSTLNETVKKIKEISSDTKVFGYSIVGCFKGFDIINEI